MPAIKGISIHPCTHPSIFRDCQPMCVCVCVCPEFLSWSWNTGPALYHPQGAQRLMGICPTSLYVFCGLGEGVPQRHHVGDVWECGIGGPLLRAVRSQYNQTSSLAHIASSKSDQFPVHAGLWQGCPLSPSLVFIFMDRISWVN